MFYEGTQQEYLAIQIRSVSTEISFYKSLENVHI